MNANTFTPTKRVITGTQARFAAFRLALRRELGLRAVMLADGAIMVHRTSLSGERYYATLQSAIDGYFRYMPESLWT